MRYQLNAIGVWSFTKLAFVVNLAAGFLFGIVYALFLILMLAIMSKMPAFDVPDLQAAMAPMGLLVVIIPIMSAIGSAVFGTLGGVIIVFVYNLASKMLGGLELTLEPVAVVSYQPATPPPAGMAAPTPPPPFEGNADRSEA